MQPESSDGLASVGTILPEETAAGNFSGRFPFLPPPGTNRDGGAPASVMTQTWATRHFAIGVAQFAILVRCCAIFASRCAMLVTHRAILAAVSEQQFVEQGWAALGQEKGSGVSEIVWAPSW